MSRVDAPRLAAYDVLRAVREDDAYANLVLPQLLRERRIEGRDAAFVTELVGGTLRGQGSYDAIVDQLAARPPDPAVRDALRLGAHQVLAMRVPDHAAVTSTVELVRERVGHKPAGFTNAIMRRIAEHDLDGVDGPAGRLDGGAPLPPGLGRRRARPRARPSRGARGAARGRQRAAAGDPGGAAGAVDGGGAGGDAGVDGSTGRRASSPLGVVLESGDPGAIPAVREGRAGVQDAGSQLVALALTRAEVEGRDERWLDLCAGPGGKAALLAALAGQVGCPPGRQRATAAPCRAGGPGAAGDRGRRGGRRRDPAGLAGRAASTGCWSTHPARGSGRCAAARRAGGGDGRRTSRISCRSSGRCSTARSTPCGPGEWCSTRPARPSSTRRPGWSAPCWPTGATYGWRTRRRWCPRPRTRRRPTSRGRCSSGRTGTAPTRCSWHCFERG